MERQVLAVRAGLGQAPLDVAVGELLELGVPPNGASSSAASSAGPMWAPKTCAVPPMISRLAASASGRVEALPGRERCSRVG